MGNIVEFTGSILGTDMGAIDRRGIEVSRVRRRVNVEMVPATTDRPTQDLAGEHTAEPIKSAEKLLEISEYLISQKRHRDNMLFVVGINFGLRISDLLRLQFYMLIDDEGYFKASFPILEKKTRNTRKTKMNRVITINEAACDAIEAYIQSRAEAGTPIRMDEYLFRSESNRCKENKALNPVSVDRILKGIAKEMGLTEHISSHSLRKTFGYHQMAMSGNDPRKLQLLQKMFGHASPRQTLDYIGLTNEEISDAYMGLNLGSKECYKRFNVLSEMKAI